MSRDESRGRSEPAPLDSTDQADASDQAGDNTAEENPRDRWDVNDPRRRDDCFAPPAEPCECWCMHCNRTFMSHGIWFQKVVNDPNGFAGFWMCPTPNCNGAGFTFDIFPTDPNHPANEGWRSGDDDWDEESIDAEDADAEWDPDENLYKALDEAFGEDDDFEGEEWKHGLQPGERPPEAEAAEHARPGREAEDLRYDQPDERPGVIDWSDREERSGDTGPGGVAGNDDIPF